jgi:hypothetical protein
MSIHAISTSSVVPTYLLAFSGFGSSYLTCEYSTSCIAGENMSNWSISFAALWLELSFWLMTAHIRLSIDSVKMKRLNRVR